MESSRSHSVLGGGQQAATVDLRVAATNNTFHGGWLFLAPAPSMAGNWVLENNLFDKVVLARDDSQPLDYDYNAYWPCAGYWPDDPNGELYPGQIPHLRDPAAHEFDLDEAPSYQRGPLGDFYIYNSATSPLHGAGSCTPAQAGLYHYTTTSVAQTKEADSAHVDIGVHYVAVDSTGKPKDSDMPTPDGIPDYVENWHGDGATDWADETHWTSPISIDPVTLETIPDPLNALYDDVDLDGDGMVGRIEKALGTDPLVPNDLLSPKRTGADPDIAGTLLALKYADLAQCGSLELDVDGTPIQNYLVAQSEQTDSLGDCEIMCNTTFIPPGEHVFSVKLCATSEPSPPESINTAQGPPLAFSVNNILVFDPACSSYYDNCPLYATLAVPTANYSISIYDPSEYPSGTPVATVTGSTTSGEIDTSWAVGTYTGDSAIASFTVWPTSTTSGEPLGTPGPPETHALPVDKRSGPVRVPDGMFSVAFRPTHVPADVFMADIAVQLGVVEPLLAPYSYHSYTPGKAYNSPFNLPVDSNGTGGYAGFLEDQAKADSLVTKLAQDAPQGSGEDNRNFYYIGHGTQDSIGDRDAPVPSIERINVSRALRNEVTVRGIKLLPHHPYRLVWLDSCKSAKNPNWATAFGIPERLTYLKIVDDKEPPQAFLGWDDDFMGPGDFDGWFQYSDTLEFIFCSWMGDQPLKWIEESATRADPFGDRSVLLPFPMRGKKLPSGAWIAHTKIYGYAFITRGGYKQAPTWSPWYK